MIPLFDNADLNSLINNNNYKFTGILLFDEFLNSEFKIKLNKDLKNLHVSTGKDLVICTFLPPSKSWLEKNYNWYEKIISNNSKVNTDLNELIKEYSRNRSKANYVALREIIIEESANEKLLIQANLMTMFHIKEADLPALILYAKDNLEFKVLKNQTIEDLAILALTLKNNNKRYFDLKLPFEAQEIFIRAIGNCSDYYREDFFDFADFVNSKELKGEELINPLSELKKEYPEFEELRNPDNFYWHNSLIRCLEQHRDLIRHYIDGINYIEDSIEIHGLDVKRIKNFWRFRVNRNFRALFHLKDNKRVHFYLGHHDYGLSRQM